MRVSFLSHRAIVLGVLVSLLWVALGTHPRAGAQRQRLPKRGGHINDFAEIIDSAAEKRLEKVLENLQQKTGIDFVVATVKTSGNEDLYDYSLRVASSWNVGPASREDSLLLVIASNSENFLTHVSSTARAKVSDDLISQTGKSLREGMGSSDFTGALVAGLRTFVDQLGAKDNFSFSSLDAQGGEIRVAVRERPRSVESPAAQQGENPKPTPLDSPSPAARATETPSPESSPSMTPVTTESPASSPNPSPAETPAATPGEIARQQPSPSATVNVVTVNSRSKPSDRKSITTPANPEDEKEEVEITLTLPLERRIETLKTFIAAHPTSVAVPRANELIVVAHALLGEQKMQSGNAEAGLQQFRLAISEAPSDMPDRLFAEVIARIPFNLFFRGMRDAAFETARQAEALAKPKAKRLLALAEFYLAVENADEAGRLAEAALQLEPDSATAHQALAAARHIALRLDEAENEYARALALDPKSAAARLGLADMKRAGGNVEAALPLYREQLQADSKSNRARAGMILSLLELGKKDEAETELNAVLQDKEQSRNLPLLVGAAYWFLAHNDLVRGLDLAQKAVTLEPRYSWAQIALARAAISDKRPLPAERGLRFARQYSRFPTLDYELASMLASVGLYDEAVRELKRSFSIKNGEIETKLAGRTAAHAASFTELLAPERRAAIFQKTAADSEANANMLKSLLAFNAAFNQTPANEDDLVAIAQQFIKGDDAMRTYRQVYVAEKFLQKGIAQSTIVELMDQAMTGVEAALSVPTATLAVQPEEFGDLRARVLARGETPEIPDAPRTALSGILRGRIEDLAGLALFNLDKTAEAVTRLRRAVNSATEGTPLWRSALWHLGAALDANGKSDQALLYYIKSYVHGPPDPARRAIIETVYKKVNGTLDGLDDKIGAAAASPSASPTPTPSPN
jgi:tetratricopeptide (TPR) repeat protein